MLKFIKNSFIKDEEGAVAVDWVVLSAAIVGVAVGAIATTQEATTGLATNISTGLTAMDVK